MCEVSLELIQNTKTGISNALSGIAKFHESDVQSQIVFLDTTVELLCRWDAAYIPKQKWFREIFTERQLAEMKAFNNYCDWLGNKYNNIPNILKLFHSADGKKLARKAYELLGQMDEV